MCRHNRVSVGSVPASGLVNVQSRIAAIQAQIASVSAPPVGVPSSLPTSPAASPVAGTTSSPTFAAALDSAVGRQALASGVSLPGALPVAAAPSGASAIQPATVAADGWIMPVNGRISSTFGHRHGVAGRSHEFHTGLDIAAAQGTPVRAASAGVVKSAGPNGNYGNSVLIDHGNGVTTRYAHNSTLSVKPGQQVRAGETIAAVGSTGRSTGPHLHFEVQVNGTHVDPVKWLKKH